MNLLLLKVTVVAIGGGLGAGLRFLASEATHDLLGRHFPFGTLVVNVIGSLLIGYLLVLLPEGREPVPHLRLLLITGLLGGFTTYSSFSIETLQLLQEGAMDKALLNIAATFLVCLFAVWSGFALARVMHGGS